MGLVENKNKAFVSAVGAARQAAATVVLGSAMVAPALRVLRAVSCSGRRALQEVELERARQAKRCALLLGCCGWSGMAWSAV